jgi:hypothetical protein
MPGLITARLVVANELLDKLVLLPAGFTEIWSHALPDANARELLIEGPFDAAIPDGARVEARLTLSSRFPDIGEWQWCFDGKPAGEPIPF